MENYKIQEVVIKNDEEVQNEIVYINDNKKEAIKRLNKYAEEHLNLVINEKWGLIENSHYTIDFTINENEHSITRKTIMDEEVVFEIEYRYLLSQ
jgi:hypothetical protein